MNLLITGANRGLGYEITAEALERGNAVIAGVRNPGKANDRLNLYGPMRVVKHFLPLLTEKDAAPTDPRSSARGIVDQIERRIVPEVLPTMPYVLQIWKNPCTSTATSQD
ncbi:hypothetical protein L1N85_12000 [Paenibacillus alkaliterrae]|uniref:hypothetical protein n=1 Tax=Paenibacillus alkaliterrae TaxID=320909 RepID=UPI001F2A3201|nr:hypothetical protein [Paenibacillus alkaliterrae]MCF2939158.1 hypothetical protein [Paenibacillus alkaliterrae]